MDCLVSSLVMLPPFTNIIRPRPDLVKSLGGGLTNLQTDVTMCSGG
jgi:hypothetical protein